MCGIAGISAYNEKVTTQLLTTMGTRLAHRGPDDSGIYQDGAVGLVHTRLSIIDLAGGHQPLSARQGELQLIANGEIYNYIELRRELEQRGHQFTTHSDCEVILHAYVEYGADFLEHIFGMFAFALYDKRRQQLLLARDRLGIKPLFLATTPQGLAFASEIKALLPAYRNTPAINPAGLAQYFQNQCSNGQTTIFDSIERVLPGELVTISQGRIVQRRIYWAASDIKPQQLDYPQAAEQFSALMETVMLQHMRSDVPFGLFLSGGLDSSILLTLLSRYSDTPIRTFSVGFPDTAVGSELSYAQVLADQYHSQHTIITPGPDDMYQRLAFCSWAADDLMRDNANLPTALLAEKAAAELKVVFTGEGSDEVFAGYGRYRKTDFELWLRNLLAPGSGGFRVRGSLNKSQTRGLFNAELSDALRHARDPFKQYWQQSPASWGNLQRMQYTDIMTALPDNLLVKADRMLMGWGVEGRVPFLDHRIVEFGLALPKALKIEGRHGKSFLRHWIKDQLPHDLIWRKKKGFSVPVGEWLKGDLLERLGQVLPQHPAIQHWCHPTVVQQLIKQQGQRDSSSRLLIALLQFAVWYQIFIENGGERPPALCDPVEFIRH